MHTHIAPLKLLLFVFSLSCSVLSQDKSLTNKGIVIVTEHLAEGTTSWELGTRAQALIELSVPALSPMIPAAPGSPPTTDFATLADIYTIARDTVVALPPPPSDGSGQPLMSANGSAGDPASLVIPVMVVGWTGQGDFDYMGAATAQIEYLLSTVPRTPDGAISHRVSEVQLWSSFVYMAIPSIAYYGWLTDNAYMLEEAYIQVKLYRNYLSDTTANGLWKHIVMGSSGSDSGHWSTGNGWAAMGIVRVLGTLMRYKNPQIFQNEINDLINWVNEIHAAMYPFQQSNGMFKNYVDNNNDFDDAASSALLAATVYRLYILTGINTFVRQADLTRVAIFGQSGSDAISSQHFTNDGWLTPVADPLRFSPKGSRTPESEAFVLMLHTAWQEYIIYYHS